MFMYLFGFVEAIVDQQYDGIKAGLFIVAFGFQYDFCTLAGS